MKEMQGQFFQYQTIVIGVRMKLNYRIIEIDENMNYNFLVIDPAPRRGSHMRHIELPITSYE
jgi:hypothetical protein